MKLTLLIASYALCMTMNNLFFKWAAMADGWRYWPWFIAGNLAGFLGCVVMPFALKLGPSNMVYALSIGGGFCLLQLSALWIFREPLSPWQWAGVGLIAAGIFLLQFKPIGMG